MGLIRQGGGDPNASKVNTTMGMREPRPPVCWSCGQRKVGQLYTHDPNGSPICGECSGSFGAGVLTPQQDSPFDVNPDAVSVPSDT